jgi:predicted outer membrane repeat protein
LGTAASSVFTVASRAVLKLDGLTIAGSPVRSSSRRRLTTAVYGGAVFVSAGATVELTDCIIGSCSAVDGGALLVSGVGASLRMTNSIISSCSATDAGGAICLLNGASLALFHVQLQNNTARYGAGICALGSGSALSLDDCNVTANSAAQAGGGLYVSIPGDTTVIANSRICSNSATVDGGGLYADFMSLQLSACSLDGNVASGFSSALGGALFCIGGVLELFNGTSLARNQAVYGGAIAIRDAALVIVTSTFVANSASIGGTLFIFPRSASTSYRLPTSLTVLGSVFEGSGCIDDALKDAAKMGGILFVESPQGVRAAAVESICIVPTVSQLQPSSSQF